MPSSTSPREWREPHDTKREFTLWFGVLAGPLVWLTLLETNYVLSYVSCELRQTWFLHVVAAVSLAIVAVAGVAAWRAGAREERLDEAPPGLGPAETSRARAVWMAYVGVATSVWFAIMILSMEVPVFVIPPCQ
jgi:hypothetical protein